MGSYCTLKLGNYEIGMSKSYINAYWACFFNEDDRRIVRMNYAEHYTEAIEESGDEVDQHEYAIDAETLKLRLELMGFTLENTENTFQTGIERVLAERTEFYNNGDMDDFRIELTFIQQLRDGGFEGWKQAAKHIIDHNMHLGNWSMTYEESRKDLYNFMVTYDDILEDLFFGFPNVSVCYILRGLLEISQPSVELTLDITDLIHAGYYEEDQPVIDHIRNTQVSTVNEFQKIVILTEGTSDTQFLKRLLKLLYPKLANYFSFLDFDTNSLEGGPLR